MRQATVRAAALSGFSTQASSLGLDGPALCAQVGLGRQAEADPNRRLPAVQVGRVLELAAARAGVDDFGLRLAMLRGFSNLGPVSLLARDEPTVGEALKVFIRYLPLHNEALSLRLDADGRHAMLAVFVAGAGPNVQATDVTVAMLVRVLRQLLGASWAPEGVWLQRPPPRDAARFMRTLGAPVRFEQPFTAIRFRLSDLARRNPMAADGLRDYAQAAVRQAAALAEPLPYAVRCRQTIEMLIGSGRCTAVGVARQMGLSRRSLDRRLQKEGTQFQALLDAVRLDLAQRQLAGTQRAIGEISDMLGFGNASAFTRWFRGQARSTPQAWRMRHRKAGAGGRP